MASYNYKPGLGNVGSFQVSGAPFVTGGVDCSGGAVKISFPAVTSWVMAQNNDSGDNPLRVAFSQNGLVANFFEIPGAEFISPLDLKVTEMWISGSDFCSVVAGLTGIETISINNSAVSPSGSNWSGSLGALVG